MENNEIELTSFNDEMLQKIKSRNVLIAHFCCFVCLKKWVTNVSWKNYHQSCNRCGHDTKPILIIDKTI